MRFVFQRFGFTIFLLLLLSNCGGPESSNDVILPPDVPVPLDSIVEKDSGPKDTQVTKPDQPILSDPGLQEDLSEPEDSGPTNKLPTLTIESPMVERPYFATRILRFRVRLSDPDTPLKDYSVSWSSSLDGPLAITSSLIQPSGPSLSTKDEVTFEGWGSLSEGLHDLSVRAETSSGEKVEANLSLSVGPTFVPLMVDRRPVKAIAINTSGQLRNWRMPVDSYDDIAVGVPHKEDLPTTVEDIVGRFLVPNYEIGYRRFMIWLPAGSNPGLMASSGWLPMATAAQYLPGSDPPDHDTAIACAQGDLSDPVCFPNLAPEFLEKPTECTDSCLQASNGLCEDGSQFAISDDCAYGSDCADCGPVPGRGRQEAWKTHLGGFIAGHPDVEVGIYLNFAKGNPWRLALQNTPEWVAPDVSTEATREWLEANLRPWVDMGVKTMGIDMGAVAWSSDSAQKTDAGHPYGANYRANILEEFAPFVRTEYGLKLILEPIFTRHDTEFYQVDGVQEVAFSPRAVDEGVVPSQQDLYPLEEYYARLANFAIVDNVLDYRDHSRQFSFDPATTEVGADFRRWYGTSLSGAIRCDWSLPTCGGDADGDGNVCEPGERDHLSNLRGPTLYDVKSYLDRGFVFYDQFSTQWDDTLKKYIADPFSVAAFELAMTYANGDGQGSGQEFPEPNCTEGD